MKHKTPNLLMTAVLFCMLFFPSCQKEEVNLPSNRGDEGITDPVIPVTGLLIPLAGNGFITKSVSGGTESITSTGLSNWTNSNAVASTFFHVSKPSQLILAFRASVPSGVSSIKAIINGQTYTINNVTGSEYKNYRIGLLNVTDSRYIKVDLQGISNSEGAVFANVSDIVVFGSSLISNISFVNNSTQYEASRKGATVRLEYGMPASGSQEWFYNEMIIPVSSDKAGTSFTSNGFDGGNAGVQITTDGQKRIQFFVSNSASGNAKLVNAGAGVEEENSSNGKSLYLPFNWITGMPYKFLTRATPDGLGGISYSSWFYASEESQWKFIATCSRPNVSNYLSGLYSSLKCENSENTFLPRRMSCINQWVYANGSWTEITNATFKGDDIAVNKQRLDYTASTDFYAFSLKNAGFVYDNNLALNSSLTRQATLTAPTVDLNNLPQ